jgi:hypothetical protein
VIELLRPSEAATNRAMVAGLACCGLALLIALLPKGALAGWLAAFGFWSSLPIGSLCLVLMIRLIPGGWRQELELQGEAALLLLSISALAILPVLIGMRGLYSWTGETGGAGFREVYLSPLFFVVRTCAFFLGLAILALFLLSRRWQTAVGAAGLIVLVPITTLAAVDWFMSLEPEFHSSGFGLYVLSIQTTIALTLLILLRLAAGSAGVRYGLLGALLLTSLLLWAYFAFMQYVITWSDNLPASVLWYQHRGAGKWSLLEYAIATFALLPALLLLSPVVRGSARWLAYLCLAVLVGKALEWVWLVLPAVPGDPAFTAASTLLAFAGLGLLNLAAIPSALRWAENLRRLQGAAAGASA